MNANSIIKKVQDRIGSVARKFYWERPIKVSAHSAKPSASLDISRLAACDPKPFRQKTTELQWAAKHVILPEIIPGITPPQMLAIKAKIKEIKKLDPSLEIINCLEISSHSEVATNFVNIDYFMALELLQSNAEQHSSEIDITCLFALSEAEQTQILSYYKQQPLTLTLTSQIIEQLPKLQPLLKRLNITAIKFDKHVKLVEDYSPNDKELIKFLFTNCPNITSLDLSNCGVASNHLEILLTFPQILNQLESLNLSHNNVYDTCHPSYFDIISACPRLSALILCDCGLDDSRVDAFEDYSSDTITELDLSLNYFSGERLKIFLQHFKNIRKLTLGKDSISDCIDHFESVLDSDCFQEQFKCLEDITLFVSKDNINLSLKVIVKLLTLPKFKTFTLKEEGTGARIVSFSLYPVNKTIDAAIVHKMEEVLSDDATFDNEKFLNILLIANRYVETLEVATSKEEENGIIIKNNFHGLPNDPLKNLRLGKIDTISTNYIEKKENASVEFQSLETLVCKDIRLDNGLMPLAEGSKIFYGSNNLLFTTFDNAKDFKTLIDRICENCGFCSCRELEIDYDYDQEVDKDVVEKLNAILSTLEIYAPFLTVLKLSGCLCFDSEIGTQKFEYITELKLSANDTESNIQFLLPKFPKLKHLQVRILVNDSTLSYERETDRQLLELESIEIEFINTDGQDGVDYLFRLLKLSPNVKRITVKFPELEEITDLELNLAEIGLFKKVHTLDFQTLNTYANPEFFEKIFPNLKNEETRAYITEYDTIQELKAKIKSSHVDFGIDIETEDTTTAEFTVTQHFANVHPAKQREQIFAITQLDFSSDSESDSSVDVAFAELKPTDEDSVTLQPLLGVEAACPQGSERGNVSVNYGDWTALPSVAPNEELVALSLVDSSGRAISYDLKSDKELSLFFIKPMQRTDVFTTDTLVDCCFDLRLPPKIELTGNAQKVVTLIDKLKEIISNKTNNHAERERFIAVFCNEICTAKLEFGELYYFLQLYFSIGNNGLPEFGKEALVGVAAEDSTFDKLAEIIRQRQGACRHRARACAFLMQQLGMADRIRIIENKCHAFVEIKDDAGVWYTLDLGGYSAKITPVVHHEIQLSDADIVAETAKFTSMSLTLPLLSPKPEEVAYANLSFQRLTELILTPQQKPFLILVNNEEEAFELHLTIQRILHENRRYCFNVNKPEDLFVGDSLQIADNKLHHVDGELKTLLSQPIDPSCSPFLLINWQQFTANQIAVAQSCLDDHEAKIGNTNIPKDLNIIGIMTKAQFKPDDSFQSRARKGYVVTVDQVPVPVSLMEDKTVLKDAATNTLCIDLFDEFDQAKLFGTCTSSADGFEYLAGVFAECANLGVELLIIDHPPVSNHEFMMLCHKIIDTKKVWLDVGIDGKQEIILPPNFKIEFRCSRYEFTGDVFKIEPKDIDDSFYLVNSASIDFLFSSFEIRDNKFINKPGLLENAKGGPAKIVITENLSTSEWAKLLAAAENLEIKLQIFVYNGVDVPSGFTLKRQDIAEPVAMEVAFGGNSQIIIAKNFKATIEKKCQKIIDSDPLAAKPEIIPITEYTTFDDLFFHIENVRYEADGTPIFAAENGHVLTQLLAGKTVFLQGKMANELFASLETLFLPHPYLMVYGQKVDITGKIIFVTDDTYTSRVVTTSVASEMEAPIVAGIRARPNKSIPSTIGATEFDRYRNKSVLSALEENRAIFIEGETATGKSYFLHHILTQSKQNIRIFDGFSDVVSWAQMPVAGQTNILFIDEANLEDPASLSMLLGIYGEPRQIFIEGKSYPLSDNHKIILAGNPKSYLNRNLKFFPEYGIPIIVFPALPDKYLREKIMGEVWNQQSWVVGEDQKAIENILFDCYKKIVAIPNINNFTPRNLQVMVMNFLTQFVSRLGSIFECDYYDVIRMCAAYAVGLEIKSHFNSEEQKLVFAQLELECTDPSIKDLLENTSKIVSENFSYMVQERWHLERIKTQKIVDKFTVTENYQDAILLLDGQLAQREFKIQFQYFGQFGTRGVCIEGPSGVGKSTLVIEYLLARGFVDGDNNKDPSILSNRKFFRFSPQMNPDKIESMLEECYQNGSIVVVEEGNVVLPAIFEAKLNGLLQAEKRPLQEGFLLITPQNPATYVARSTGSQAFNNRFAKATVDLPSVDELRMILIHKFPGQTSTINFVLELMEKSVEDTMACLNEEYELAADNFVQLDLQMQCAAVKQRNPRDIYHFVEALLQLTPKLQSVQNPTFGTGFFDERRSDSSEVKVVSGKHPADSISEDSDMEFMCGVRRAKREPIEPSEWYARELYERIWN